ncbi:MAG TPA: decarboxylating NADP(+)-dependent phosphogluconate dehydrogenase [Candidatus Saccharimonadia bacterium]|nr:decarboxylating NADP(+)-dependent phosphogluconate dehydrogenase [Candidatus Saccharimonadia bacterium]
MNEGDADIAVMGLAVMGQNLILNMNDHGFKVVAFNRTVSKVDDFLNREASGTNVVGARTVEELAAKLKRPRRVMLMVKAGEAVDETIEHLLPVLEPGDIIIDGGNSLFTDTARRVEYVESKGLLYIGTGVSGGEEGARHGPSIMPGGSPDAWPHVKNIFQTIAAKAPDGSPCCDWVGDGGAGHYVKMVHNGIEYGDMQLIAEAYQLLKDYSGLDYDQMAQVFADWNQGELDSYLIQITSEILAYKDQDGQPLVEKILDAAGQKGTGKWTVQSAADLGQPVSLITEAVFARSLSALKEQRVEAAKVLKGSERVDLNSQEGFNEMARQALYAAKIVSYAQGYMLMRAAAEEYGWKLNYGGIAQMWRGGCIIRSRFLGDIKAAYDKQPELANLLLDSFFASAINANQASWRGVVASAVYAGIPVPAMGSALSFYDGYRSGKLPANLIQAQRDYFGAHTYERADRPRGEFFHTNWTGHGGTTSAGSYNA